MNGYKGWRNLRELRHGEVRKIPLPRTPVNRVRKGLKLLGLGPPHAAAATTGRGAHLSQEILACVLPLLEGATISGGLGAPRSNLCSGLRHQWKTDLCSARIVDPLKIAEAGLRAQLNHFHHMVVA